MLPKSDSPKNESPSIGITTAAENGPITSWTHSARTSPDAESARTWRTGMVPVAARRRTKTQSVAKTPRTTMKPRRTNVSAPSS